MMPNGTKDHDRGRHRGPGPSYAPRPTPQRLDRNRLSVGRRRGTFAARRSATTTDWSKTRGPAGAPDWYGIPAELSHRADVHVSTRPERAYQTPSGARARAGTCSQQIEMVSGLRRTFYTDQGAGRGEPGAASRDRSHLADVAGAYAARRGDSDSLHDVAATWSHQDSVLGGDTYLLRPLRLSLPEGAHRAHPGRPIVPAVRLHHDRRLGDGHTVLAGESSAASIRRSRPLDSLVRRPRPVAAEPAGRAAPRQPRMTRTIRRMSSPNYIFDSVPQDAVTITKANSSPTW